MNDPEVMFPKKCVTRWVEDNLFALRVIEIYRNVCKVIRHFQVLYCQKLSREENFANFANWCFICEIKFPQKMFFPFNREIKFPREKPFLRLRNYILAVFFDFAK